MSLIRSNLCLHLQNLSRDSLNLYKKLGEKQKQNLADSTFQSCILQKKKTQYLFHISDKKLLFRFTPVLQFPSML